MNTCRANQRWTFFRKEILVRRLPQLSMFYPFPGILYTVLKAIHSFRNTRYVDYFISYKCFAVEFLALLKCMRLPNHDHSI